MYTRGNKTVTFFKVFWKKVKTYNYRTEYGS